MFERILLPISGSDESKTASEFAVQLAKIHNSQIIALSVVDTTVVRQIARASGKSPGEVEIEIEENGWHYLYYADEIAKDNKVRIIVLLEHGLPQDKVLNKAREYKVDLIILGQSTKRGTYGISQDRFLQYVLEQAPCPVLIIK
ncbi:TPA: universal stress protein [Candidatus Poribacteria bacterium]|nr:universal stress protein [Candidatus Poribacteria bacterium]